MEAGYKRDKKLNVQKRTKSEILQWLKAIKYFRQEVKSNLIVLQKFNGRDYEVTLSSWNWFVEGIFFRPNGHNSLSWFKRIWSKSSQRRPGAGPTSSLRKERSAGSKGRAHIGIWVLCEEYRKIFLSHNPFWSLTPQCPGSFTINTIPSANQPQVDTVTAQSSQLRFPIPFNLILYLFCGTNIFEVMWYLRLQPFWTTHLASLSIPFTHLLLALICLLFYFSASFISALWNSFALLVYFQSYSAAYPFLMWHSWH